MSKGIGRQLQFGVAKETVRGTVEAAATFYIPFAEFTLDEVQNDVIHEQNYGVIEDSSDRDIVLEYTEGSVSAPIGSKHFGLILLATLGSVNTAQNADASGNVYDHTFSVGQSAQHQALSLFVDDPLGGQDYKHALGVITSLEIQYKRGSLMQYTAELMAKKGQDAVLAPATTTEYTFNQKHFAFKLANSKAGLGAASEIKLKSLSLTIEKNIEIDEVLGQGEPEDFLNKQFSIEGELEATWQNETDFKDVFVAGTTKAMRIDLDNTDVTIGTAENPRLMIDLAKVKITEVSRPISNNEIVMQTVSFKAFYSASDTEMIEAVLTNLMILY